MEDKMLFDGDQQRYLQLLANGGEEEVGIDASDVDSSDVASSNDIDSSDDDSDTGGGAARDKLSSSVARSVGRGKRGRAAIGASAVSPAEDPNPLMAEIGSKSERRQAAAQRWFNDPLFEGVDETLEAEDDEDGQVGDVMSVGGDDDDDDEQGEEGDDESSKPAKKRIRRGGGGEGGGEKGKRRGGREEPKQLGAAEALMAAMPKTDKEKRKEKRKKVLSSPFLTSLH